MLKRLAQDPAFTVMTLRGVPVRLQTSIVILPLWAAAAGYLGGGAHWRGALFMIVLVFLLYLCAGLHELGHIIPARRFGASVTRVRISGLGAFVLLESKAAPTPWQELMIALGGPLASALLSLVLVVAAWPFVTATGMVIFFHRDAPALIAALALTNVLLTVFNLLPVFPMDGGRALHAVRALSLSPMQPARLASVVRCVLALALVATSMFWADGLAFRATALLTAGLALWVSLRAERRLRTS